jgi:aryl-alcohol dehydrogenase-like predicted oxidoreductase
MSRALELAVTPWAVVGGGVLTGKYTGNAEQDAQADHKREPSDKRLNERNLHIAAVVKQIAAETGYPAAQVAINWVRQQPGLIIPIMGARTADQLAQNLGCLEWQLTAEQVQRLAEVSAIDLGFPHEFLREDYIKELVFGNKWPQIDNHRGNL